jgi:antitoxin (DNA-binding transcriptional repressor) of toxin-antitoxin stability system
MNTIKPSEFKLKCLHLMDVVNQSGEGIVITKNGKPVSKLGPFREPITTLFGFSKDSINSRDDLTKPLSIDWDVEHC